MEQLTTFTKKCVFFKIEIIFFSMHCIRLSTVYRVWYKVANVHDLWWWCICIYNVCTQLTVVYNIARHFWGIPFLLFSWIIDKLHNSKSWNKHGCTAYNGHDCACSRKLNCETLEEWRLAFCKNWTLQNFHAIRYYVRREVECMMFNILGLDQPWIWKVAQLQLWCSWSLFTLHYPLKVVINIIFWINWI